MDGRSRLRLAPLALLTLISATACLCVSIPGLAFPTTAPSGANRAVPTAPWALARPAATGGRIAFQTSRDHGTQIYVTNADASGQIRLTDAPGLVSHPVWPPTASASSSSAWAKTAPRSTL